MSKDDRDYFSKEKKPKKKYDRKERRNLQRLVFDELEKEDEYRTKDSDEECR